MPASCAIASCKISVRNKPSDKISFFRFPRDPKIRKLWVQKCDRPIKFRTDHATICSNHFLPSDYERNYKAELLNMPARKILKSGAVPSINLTSVIVTPSHLFDFVDCSPRIEVLESMVDENTSGDILKDLVVKNDINLLTVEKNKIKLCSQNATNGIIENDQMSLLKIQEGKTEPEFKMNPVNETNGEVKNIKMPHQKLNAKTRKSMQRKSVNLNDTKKNVIVQKDLITSPKEKNKKQVKNGPDNGLLQNADTSQMIEKLQEENKRLKNTIQKKNDELKECKRKIAELTVEQVTVTSKRKRKVPKWLIEN